MTNNKNLKTYRVTINLPPEHQTGDETKVIQAASVIDAKTAFVLAYYGHPFTAQFKLIRVEEIKEPYEYTPAPWSDEMQEMYEEEREWGKRWNDELQTWV